MSVENSFAKAIRDVRKIVEGDGVIDLTETAWLLRISRTCAEKGNLAARELVKLLDDVRADGVVTAEESRRILKMLESIASGGLGLADYVKAVPDFPRPGLAFRDATGVLANAGAFRLAVDLMVKSLEGRPVDLVVTPESGGLAFGAALADRLGAAFAPVRKPGKLPRETVSETFARASGPAELHLHADAVIPGMRVAVVDDLLATGATAAVAARLVERLGGQVVKMLFVVEQEGSGAREGALKGRDVESLVKFEA